MSQGRVHVRDAKGSCASGRIDFNFLSGRKASIVQPNMLHG
jgi:hypothetical protein